MAAALGAFSPALDNANKLAAEKAGDAQAKHDMLMVLEEVGDAKLKAGGQGRRDRRLEPKG